MLFTLPVMLPVPPAACDKMAANFENDWKQWEAGQYGRPDSVYLTPAQGKRRHFKLPTPYRNP
jgi:hypothetical protein